MNMEGVSGDKDYTCGDGCKSLCGNNRYFGDAVAREEERLEMIEGEVRFCNGILLLLFLLLLLVWFVLVSLLLFLLLLLSASLCYFYYPHCHRYYHYCCYCCFCYFRYRCHYHNY